MKRAVHQNERRYHITGNLIRVPVRRRTDYLRFIRPYRRHFVPIEDRVFIYGHKNIDCPYYAKCLDAACKIKSYWVCNGCPHEFTFSDKTNELFPIYDVLKTMGEENDSREEDRQ